jgi:hypothetical protein
MPMPSLPATRLAISGAASATARRKSATSCDNDGSFSRRRCDARSRAWIATCTVSDAALNSSATSSPARRASNSSVACSAAASRRESAAVGLEFVGPGPRRWQRRFRALRERRRRRRLAGQHAEATLYLGQARRQLAGILDLLAETERVQQCLRRVHRDLAGRQSGEDRLGLLRWRPLEVDWCLDRRRLGDGDRTARPGVGWVPRDRSSHQRRGSEANNDRPIDVAVIDIKMPASSEANGTIFLLQFNFAFLHSATAPNEPKSRR